MSRCQGKHTPSALRCVCSSDLQQGCVVPVRHSLYPLPLGWGQMSNSQQPSTCRARHGVYTQPRAARDHNTAAGPGTCLIGPASESRSISRPLLAASSSVVIVGSWGCACNTHSLWLGPTCMHWQSRSSMHALCAHMQQPSRLLEACWSLKTQVACQSPAAAAPLV